MIPLENPHLKPDLGAFSHHEKTLTLNTHTPLLTSLVVYICQVSGQAAIVSKNSLFSLLPMSKPVFKIDLAIK